MRIDSPLWLGLADIGTSRSRDESFRAMDRFFELGGRTFDVAHCYAAWKPEGYGVPERLLGEWIRDRNVRHLVQVSTKGGHCGFPNYPRPDRFLDPILVQNDLRESLDRLQMESVDIFFLHRDHSGENISELARMMCELRSSGKIREGGISNWSAERARQMASACPATKYWQNQWSLGTPNWHPTDKEGTLRYHIAEDLKVATETALILTPFSATANGFYGSNGELGHGFDNPGNRQRLARVQKVAEATGFTQAQVAILWLTSQPLPVYPIIGTLNPDRIEELMAVMGQGLSPETLDYLDLKLDFLGS